MAKKKKITNAQHFKNAALIYNQSGLSGVCDYADTQKIGYEFCKACDTDSPQIKHICLVCGQPTSIKYIVSVCRTSHAFLDIEVTAQNETEALELAIDDAGNHEFSEKSADYTTDGLREK